MQAFLDRFLESGPVQERHEQVLLVEVQVAERNHQVILWEDIFRRFVVFGQAIPLEMNGTIKPAARLMIGCD
jgi:hypothetical protein